MSGCDTERLSDLLSKAISQVRFITETLVSGDMELTSQRHLRWSVKGSRSLPGCLTVHAAPISPLSKTVGPSSTRVRKGLLFVRRWLNSVTV